MNLKKVILLFCLICISNIANAQNNSVYVEYNFTDNSIHKQANAILVYNDSTSVFVTYLAEKTTNPSSKENNILIGELNDVYKVVNKNTELLKTYRVFEGEVLEISEKTTNFNWNINYKEEKKIGSYSCKKATTTFRGRDYTAWYYDEIPTYFGPWKFNGLPGLIIEITDNTQTFSWKCSSIKISSKDFIQIPYEEYSTISIQQYVIKVKEYIEKLRTRVRGILPRGMQYKAPKNSRIGLELIYEWEKDE